MFDEIYWSFIDPNYFGPLASVEARVGLLSEEERRELDDLVGYKMEQTRTQSFEEHYTSDRLVDLYIVWITAL